MNAQLTRPVDSKKNKPGDSVTAKTTENVKSDGQVVIPKGSKLVGHVTQAKARAKGESESALGIVFDKAILKNGQEVPLNAGIQALAVSESAAAASLAGDDLSAAGSAGGGAMGSGRAAGGGGLVGGVGSTAGGAVGTVTNTAANVGGAASGTVSSTLGAAGSASAGAVGGLNATGQLASNSRGVFGLQGLNLNVAAANSTGGSVITSTSKNVHLDSGTRMLLVAQGQAQGQGQQAAKPQPKAAEREPMEREKPQSKPPIE
jgi:hypothetical protein